MLCPCVTPKKDFTIGLQLSPILLAFYDFLVSVGLTPTKSKSIPYLTVPDEYYDSFLRGLFDGDGSCYAYYDTRWKSSFMFYTAFTSASPEFITYLSRTNMRLIGVTSGSVRQGKRAQSLVYAKKDSHLIYSFLYRDNTNLFLTRKKSKLETFVEHDRGGILA